MLSARGGGVEGGKGGRGSDPEAVRERHVCVGCVVGDEPHDERRLKKRANGVLRYTHRYRGRNKRRYMHKKRSTYKKRADGVLRYTRRYIGGKQKAVHAQKKSK